MEKYLEMTFIVIQHYINEIELNYTVLLCIFPLYIHDNNVGMMTMSHEKQDPI